MRISDWSSDVCSSDLVARDAEELDRASQRERIGRDDAHVRLDVDEAARVERLGVDDGRVDVGEDLELARAAHVVAVAGCAVADDAVAVGGVPDLAGLERFDHAVLFGPAADPRSEEHTSELQSLLRNAYAVFCLTKHYNNN